VKAAGQHKKTLKRRQALPAENAAAGKLPCFRTVPVPKAAISEKPFLGCCTVQHPQRKGSFMSIKSRLALKTGDLVKPFLAPPQDAGTPGALGAAGEVPAAPSPAESRAPRTGPGQMLAFRSHMQENNQKVEGLQAQLKEFEGSLPVKMLDPREVYPSQWANRHAASFSLPAFASLKLEIESAGGNVQPIKVRPRVESVGGYEIVFGHRRHRACLELGIPVAALVQAVDDKALFAAMDRENRLRADLSPFEQGQMYRRALDEGLYASLRQLAYELGVDPGNVSRAVSIARLPAEVVAAFGSPTQIQYRWGQELQAALQRDAEGVVARARAISQAGAKFSDSQVLDRLTGKAPAPKPGGIALKKQGKTVGKLLRKSDGAISLSLQAGVMDEAAYGKLQAAVEALLASD
jgi:ParB family chromosome partitioning protein